MQNTGKIVKVRSLKTYSSVNKLTIFVFNVKSKVETMTPIVKERQKMTL